MPNAGFTRYTIVLVGAIALVYSLVTGNEMTLGEKQSWTDALNNSFNTIALLYMMGAALYSKLFPSEPTAMVPKFLKPAIEKRLRARAAKIQ